MATAVLALAGSRLLFVLTNLGIHRTPGEMLRLTTAGHVVYGGPTRRRRVGPGY